MLLNLKNNLYLITLISGTLIASSSSSWFSCWLGLEINLMSLIPMIIYKINPSSSEAGIKYFINQSLASVLIIFSAIYFFINTSLNFISTQNILIIMGIGMKIGAAPLHFWLPQVIQTAEWSQILIILTWQKIAPMTLMMFSMNMWVFFLVYMSCLTGVLGAINQTSLKKIIVYSSILHSAWMLSAISCSESIWWMYFLLYSAISASVMIIFSFTLIYSIKQMFNPIMPTPTTLIFLINFFSLAGIPPFLGFFMKLTTMTSMISLQINFLTIGLLILSSLLALYFYTRFIFTSSVLSITKFSLMFKLIMSSVNKLTFLTLSILGNLIIPLLLYFI